MIFRNKVRRETQKLGIKSVGDPDADEVCDIERRMLKVRGKGILGAIHH